MPTTFKNLEFPFEAYGATHWPCTAWLRSVVLAQFLIVPLSLSSILVWMANYGRSTRRISMIWPLLIPPPSPSPLPPSTLCRPAPWSLSLDVPINLLGHLRPPTSHSQTTDPYQSLVLTWVCLCSEVSQCCDSLCTVTTYIFKLTRAGNLHTF